MPAQDVALGISLWSIALIALPLTVRYYRRSHVPRWWTVGISIFATPLVGLLALRSILLRDWLVGMAMPALAVCAFLFIVAYNARKAAYDRERVAEWEQRLRAVHAWRRRDRAGRSPRRDR